MMGRLLRFLLAAVAVSTVTQHAFSQKVVIKGHVSDENGEPVELATVNESHQMVSAMTNLKGDYELSPRYQDTLELVFRMVGHETRKRTITLPGDTVVLNVMLPNSGYALQGVTVSDMRRQTDGNQTIDIGRAGLTPGASGSAIESLIATQAGVSSHNELSSQYNVRGGNFDENSVYVNGTEILRPLLVRAGEQEGLSFIVPDMVESISFSTGGFSAAYGDRMSSVLDIRYRRPETFEAKVSASMLGAEMFIGYGNDRFSISNSLRYKTNRYLLGTLDTRGEYDPDFLDYQLYVTFKPSDKWDIGFIGNAALNSYSFTPSDRNTTFGTAGNAKQFKVYFGGWEKDRFNTLFGAFNVTRRIDGENEVRLNVSLFDSNERETYDITSQYWLNEADEEEQMSIGTFMEHSRNSLDAMVSTVGLTGDHRAGRHSVRWGLETRFDRIHEKMREWETRDSAGYMVGNAGAVPLKMIYSLRSDQRIADNRTSAFIQDTWRTSLKSGLLTLNAGIRASYWDWNGEFIASPRFTLGFIPAANDNLTFRLSGGVYYQTPFYRELKDTVNTEGIGTVRLNRGIKSQRSVQTVIGGDYHFRMFARPFKFTAELYYKKLKNLIPYNVDNVRIVYYGRNCSSGYAYGVDTKLFGEFVPGADSWITFSLMKTEEVIGGRRVPRPTDQRFNFSLHFTDFFPGTDRWQMTLRCCFADGLPFGPSHSGREKAVFRAPAYKRADIGMSYAVLREGTPARSYRKSSMLRNVWLGVDCLNLFGINNVNSYYWITDVGGTQFAVPNYLTGRQVNLRVRVEFRK